MKNKSFLRASLAGLLLVVVVSSGIATGAHPFTDVPDGRFYSEAVDWAFNNGITTGTSATTFEPDSTVTRGENITFAKRYDDFVVQPALAALEAADYSHHWIWVNGGAGTTLAGSTGVSAVRTAAGSYTVTFPVDIRECAWSSAQRNAGGLFIFLYGDIDMTHALTQGGVFGGLPIFLFTVDPMEIDVTVWDISDAAAADDDFQLDVVC